MQKFFIFCFIPALSICQLLHQPIHLAFQHDPQQIIQAQPLAHRAVVENAIQESQLPPELTNDFYKNPTIADALAKESWFSNKEMPVLDRESEKIPREMIFKIFKSAGFIKRR